MIKDLISLLPMLGNLFVSAATAYTIYSFSLPKGSEIEDVPIGPINFLRPLIGQHKSVGVDDNHFLRLLNTFIYIGLVVLFSYLACEFINSDSKVLYKDTNALKVALVTAPVARTFFFGGDLKEIVNDN